MTGPSPTVCRTGKNRISGCRLAIIFVPGVLGSRIQFTQDNNAWDPDSHRNMFEWSLESCLVKRDLLNCGRKGVIFRNPAQPFFSDHDSKVDRGWGGVRWASYGSFLEAAEDWRFGSNQTPVYAYGYDWRQPIAQSGLQLAADVLGASQSASGRSASCHADRFGASGLLDHAQTEKCVFITHSMGGLITRMALKQSAALRSKTVAVLHGEQPESAGLLLYKRMFSGISEPDSVAGFETKVFQSIIGPGPIDKIVILSRCPGPTQLLPSNLFRDAGAMATTVSGMVSKADLDAIRAGVRSAASNASNTAKKVVQSNSLESLRSVMSPQVLADIAARIVGMREFHTLLAEWKLEGRTWAFLDTDVGEQRVHQLPRAFQRLVQSAERVVQVVAGAGAPPGAVDAARHAIAAVGGGGNGSANSIWPRGYDTLLRLVGLSLFADHESVKFDSWQPLDFSNYRQYLIDAATDESSYRNLDIQRISRAWTHHVLSTLT